jgi:hypothetical protein
VSYCPRPSLPVEILAWLTKRFAELLYDGKRHAHTAQGLAVTTVGGDLPWRDGGWPGSCREQDAPLAMPTA